MRHCYTAIIHFSKPANCSCEWVYLPRSIIEEDGMSPSSSALDADQYHANPN